MWCVKPLLILIAFVFGLFAQPAPTHFNGKRITIHHSKLDENGFAMGGPASVCIEADPEPKCFVAPEAYVRNPRVQLIRVAKDAEALLFSADTIGVSGFRILYALLRSGEGPYLENMFLSETSTSNLSDQKWFHFPSVSSAPVFVTADWTWGPNESHYSPHRYVISAFLLLHSDDMQNDFYILAGKYMTTRVYDLEKNPDILLSEKTEILKRLKRVNSEWKRRIKRGVGR